MKKTSIPTIAQVKRGIKSFQGYREKSIIEHPQAKIIEAKEMGEGIFYCESPSLDYRFCFSYGRKDRPNFDIIG